MEPTGVTATALARLVARREVSAREVAEAHLRRIEAAEGIAEFRPRHPLGRQR